MDLSLIYFGGFSWTHLVNNRAPLGFDLTSFLAFGQVWAAFQAPGSGIGSGCLFMHQQGPWLLLHCSCSKGRAIQDFLCLDHRMVNPGLEYYEGKSAQQPGSFPKAIHAVDKLHLLPLQGHNILLTESSFSVCSCLIASSAGKSEQPGQT